MIGMIGLLGCGPQVASNRLLEMRRMNRLLIAIFTMAVIEPAVFAHDWPQFRGPNLDKISQETNWTAEALVPKPKIAWRRDIGIGYSGPAIVGDAVYVVGYADGKEHVRRLRASDGEVVWTHSYAGGQVDNMNAGGPGATPTVKDKYVYTNGRQGQVHCLAAADGEVIWSVQLTKRYNVKVPIWGFSSSPLLVDGKLILDAGRLVALDPHTGKEIWKSNKSYKPGYGTPTPFEFQGKTFVAHLNNDGLTVVNVDDGREVAFYDIQAQFNTAATSPIVHNDTIWVSVGYDGRCALLRFTGESLEKIYSNRDLKNHFNTSVLIDGYVYGVHGQANHARTCTLVCMDYDTGEVAWEQRGGGFGTLSAAGDSLLYLNASGMVAVIPANPKGFKVAAKAQILRGQCWTSPVLAGGKLYCRNSAGMLVAVDMRE